MKVAVSWTGGKDSALACYKAMKEHEVALFVHFMWEKPSPSHPTVITKLQSEAVETKFLWDRLDPPYRDAYRESILELKNEFGIEAIVTGDITVDSFHGAWIDEVCKDTGVKALKPLWEMDRNAILNDLICGGFKVIFTCVKEPGMTADWLGRTIDPQAVKEMEVLHEKNGLDICGEFGEYHTMTLDAPFFIKTIQVPKFKVKKVETSFILEPVELSLKPKKHRGVNKK
jgi:diphthine-ammonia ligase